MRTSIKLRHSIRYMLPASMEKITVRTDKYGIQHSAPAAVMELVKKRLKSLLICAFSAVCV